MRERFGYLETANGEVEDEGTDDTEMEGATRKERSKEWTLTDDQ